MGHNIVNVHVQLKLAKFMAIGFLFSAKFCKAKFGLW